MAPRSFIKVLNPQGELQTILTDWVSLTYTNRQNAPGDHKLTIDGNSDNIQYFLVDSLIQVWRNIDPSSQGIPPSTFVPTDISGCKLWLDASQIVGLSDGDPISTWNDESGNNNYATAAGGTRPLYKTNILNGRAVARFDGIDDFLTHPLNYVQPWTIIVVFDPSGAQANGAMIISNGNNGLVTSPSNYEYLLGDSATRKSAAFPASAHIVMYQQPTASPNDAVGYVNNIDTTLAQANNSGFGLSNKEIGKGYSGRVITGDIAEIIVYDSSLSSGDRADLYAYLYDKYFGPPVPFSGWYMDYEGLHRTEEYATLSDGSSTFTSWGRTLEDLLSRRSILYPEESVGATRSGPGETVIKGIVKDNLGSDATVANGRSFDGVIPNFDVEVDGAAGSAWEGDRSNRNVLEVLQEIAKATNVDFKVQDDGIDDGILPSLLQFRAKALPWGLDRSTAGIDPTTGLNGSGNAPVVLALEYGNMGAAQLSFARNDQGTAIIMLGSGTEDEREIAQVLDAGAIAESPWNRREVVRQSSFEDTASALEDAANAVLEQVKTQESFSFEVLQVENAQYGRDYLVGDIITAKYKNFTQNYEIVEATVRLDNTEYVRIQVASRGIPAQATQYLLSRVRGLEALSNSLDTQVGASGAGTPVVLSTKKLNFDSTRFSVTNPNTREAFISLLSAVIMITAVFSNMSHLEVVGDNHTETFANMSFATNVV